MEGVNKRSSEVKRNDNHDNNCELVQGLQRVYEKLPLPHTGKFAQMQREVFADALVTVECILAYDPMV